MSRRGENIYKRKDQRWEGRYIKGRGSDGKVIYGYVYAKTYGEARTKLLPFKYRYLDHSRQSPEFTGSVIDWTLICMEEIVKSKIKQSTYAYYQGILRNHIIPRLGNKKLCGLTQKDIQTFVDDLSRAGLSSGSIRGIFVLLNSFLKKAVKKSVIPANPCEDVSLPKKSKQDIGVLSGAEQKQLERVALNDEKGIPVLLALYTGMRIGEICALTWKDIDLKAGIIHVRRTLQRITCQNEEKRTKIVLDVPKSEKSDRLIPLPPQLGKILTNLYERSDGDYVVSCKGSFAEPRTVRYRYYQILKKAGIRHVHFHVLRHTFATRCMELRFDVTTLSRLLGHSSVKMTLDIYTDSLLEQKILSMRMLDDLFPVSAA